MVVFHCYVSLPEEYVYVCQNSVDVTTPKFDQKSLKPRWEVIILLAHRFDLLYSSFPA